MKSLPVVNTEDDIYANKKQNSTFQKKICFVFVFPLFFFKNGFVKD